MMPRFIALSDCPPQAWRNGGGQTRELLAWPARDAWQVRISVADVAQDGPFSHFVGVHRHLVVWQGAGLRLSSAGAADPVHLTPASAPWSFSGELPVQASLMEGPARDLNLMCRGVAGGVLRAVPHQPWSPVCGAAGVFATQTGRLWARSEAGSSAVLSWPLPPTTLCWFDTAPVQLWWAPDEPASDPRAWWLEAHLKDEWT